MQQQNDPRATQIHNVGQQQQQLDQAIKQIPKIQYINFDKLIQLFTKCFLIRQQPQFIKAIFQKKQIYQELVLWILDPFKIIKQRQKNNQKMPPGDWKRTYPYICMQIAQNNQSFYINLYIKACQDQSFINLWFQFLKQPQLQTLDTSLGYFLQIMMPFINYKFSDATQICQIVQEPIGQQILMSSSVIRRQETPVSKQRQLISSQKKKCLIQKQISIMNIFSDQLFSQIFQYIEHQPIFKFVHNFVLVTLQQTDLKRSKRIFEFFLKKALEIKNLQIQSCTLSGLEKSPKMDICNQYIWLLFKQIYENANTDKNYIVIFFIDSIIRVQLINVFIQRIRESFLLVKSNSQEKLSSSTDFNAIVAEQQTLEYYIKSLTLLIKLYSKMNKNEKSDQQKERQSKYYGEELPDSQQQQVSGQNKVMKLFQTQINQIFVKLPQLSQIVKKNQTRVIPFSSGQNIKPITICKYQFFDLLYNCLLLSMSYPLTFVLDTQKINIFSIIERYLNQNRWNNMAHKLLQKITCLLIKNNKNFFRTNKNNMADQFLNTLIQSFTNKNYIFLQSLRFTSQGNLHTLYTIARGIINKLKESHNLANFVHQLDYYKKFVMDDLQTYQKKFQQIQYPADSQDLNASQAAEQYEQMTINIDQTSSVRDIVKKIDIVNKWPAKQNKRKHGSFIHRSLSYASDQHQIGTSIDQRKKIILPPPSEQILNTDQDQQTEQQPYDKIHLTGGSRNNRKTQVQYLTKSNDDLSRFYKHRDNRINLNQSIDKEQQLSGKGLFISQNNKERNKQEGNFELSLDYKIQEMGRSAQSKKGKTQNLESIKTKHFFSSIQKKQTIEQDFNLNNISDISDNENNELLHINVTSSDKKIVKTISIDEEVKPQQFTEVEEELKKELFKN